MGLFDDLFGRMSHPPIVETTVRHKQSEVRKMGLSRI